MAGQELRDRRSPMNRAPVPEHDDDAGQMAEQQPQEQRDLDLGDVVAVEVGVEPTAVAAGAGLLFLTPIFLTVLTAYFLTLTAILGKLKRLTLSTLLGVAAVMGAAVGSSFYNQGLAVGGRSDAIRSFLTFSLGTFICLGSGCAIWWWLGRDTPR